MATSAGRSGSTSPRRRRRAPPGAARPRQPTRWPSARLPTTTPSTAKTPLGHIAKSPKPLDAMKGGASGPGEVPGGCWGAHFPRITGGPYRRDATVAEFPSDHLHRQRSVIVRQSESGEQLWAVRIASTIRSRCSWRSSKLAPIPRWCWRQPHGWVRSEVRSAVKVEGPFRRFD